MDVRRRPLRSSVAARDGPPSMAGRPARRTPSISLGRLASRRWEVAVESIVVGVALLAGVVTAPIALAFVVPALGLALVARRAAVEADGPGPAQASTCSAPASRVANARPTGGSTKVLVAWDA